MVKCITINILIIFELLIKCYGANILMLFTIASRSHHLMYRPIIDALAERNHTIVLVTTDPIATEQRRNNIYEIDLHDVSYTIWKKHLAAYAGLVSTNKDAIFNTVIWAELCKETIDMQLNSTAMKTFLKEGPFQFDVVLGSVMHVSNLAFSKIFGAPFIGLQPSNIPCEMHQMIGNSFHYEYYHDIFTAPTGSRIRDLYERCIANWYFFAVLADYEQNVKKHLTNDINLKTAAENMDLVLLPANHEWALVRPVMPNTHFIGDARAYKGKPLDQKLQKFLDESPSGVVYISLGTNILSSNLSPQRLGVFIETMKTIPYRVLWKWESTQLPDLPPNVLTAQWFPQGDVLSHPNVKVFVTHGGLLSISEALYHEVPVVVIPFFGDQHFNAMRVKDLGIGEVLDSTNMTAKDLEKAITNVGANISFTDKMEMVSDRLFDKQVSSAEAAVWWVEYMIKHRSGFHFQHPRISTTEYLMLDVIGVVVLCLFIITAGFYNFIAIPMIIFFHRKRVHA